jgi:hypothetical protein
LALDSAHQHFLKYLCIATKVENAVKIAKKAIASEKCVVINLQSTCESQTLELIKNGGHTKCDTEVTKRMLSLVLSAHQRFF